MTVHYADSAGAQGSGDGSSAANAATLKAAVENTGLAVALAAGDIIYLKAGTEITWDGSAAVYSTPAVTGTETAPIRVEVYTTTPGDAVGMVTIRDTNAGGHANGKVFDCNGIDCWYWRGIKCYQVYNGWDLETTSDGHQWVDCWVDAFTQRGFNLDGASGVLPVLINCRATNGTGSAAVHGFYTSCRAPRLINCVAINNQGSGFVIGNASYGAHLFGCIAHANGVDGFVVTGESTLINCVANRNGSDGIYVADSDFPTVLINCGATSNGAYGVEGAAGTIVTAINCGLNPTNEANTSGQNSANVTLLEIGAVAGDPLYMAPNTATKTDVDLRLKAGSAWINAGLGMPANLGGASYPSIGATHRQENYPAVANVEDGVLYGPNDEYEGTLVGGGGTVIVIEGE